MKNKWRGRNSKTLICMRKPEKLITLHINLNMWLDKVLSNKVRNIQNITLFLLEFMLINCVFCCTFDFWYTIFTTFIHVLSGITFQYGLVTRHKKCITGNYCFAMDLINCTFHFSPNLSTIDMAMLCLDNILYRYQCTHNLDSVLHKYVTA